MAAALEEPDNELGVSPIVLWDVLMLAERGRVDGTGAALVKLRFDRGTILLADPPNSVNLAAAPRVLWDRRVRAYHAAPCGGRS